MKIMFFFNIPSSLSPTSFIIFIPFVMLENKSALDEFILVWIMQAQMGLHV